MMYNIRGILCHNKETQTENEAPNNGLSNKRKRGESEEGEIGMEIDAYENTPIPLKMGSILEIILGFMDAESIKTARHVAKRWSIEGAKVLLSKCYVKIPSDLLNAKSTTKNETMAQFKAFLACKSNEVSMIPKITVTSAAELELWKSLRVLGPQVNSLKFPVVWEKELLQKLLDLLPNLKYLNFGDDRNCVTGYRMINTLTSAVSNRNGNPLIISSPLHWMPLGLSSMQDIEKFCELRNIKLDHLIFGSTGWDSSFNPQYDAQMAIILSKLLSTSQSTLKKLDLVFCKTSLSLVQFPLMPNLKRLSVSFLKLTPYKFSPCFRFSEKVPNLESFSVDCQNLIDQPNILENLLENSGTAPSVKIVSCAPSLTGCNLDLLFQVFPNIKTFNIQSSAYTYRTVHWICQNGRVIERLGIFINMDRFNEQVADLDFILTGFTQETVDKIKKAPNGISDDVEKLRVNPSILDLKELKHLEVNFSGTRYNVFPERALDFAGKYAFKFMPKDSKISIHVLGIEASAIAGARAALDEVSKLPNVTVKFVDKIE